ncbi:DUF4910 domain-containing protein [Paenisporosarcina indica]|uniref:DUF4910 domain-containing protein n=1 Tax=Paenisporosarcina indica TaxID=650093 RepID=UPI00094FAB43|nr:DUF4910 domain-containing protein [Paenisporosarcina indica]
MSHPLHKIALAAILGFCTAVPIGIFATHYTAAQDNLTNSESAILQTLDGDQIYNHINTLSKTPRVAGTKQEDAAATYIKKQFESYGYKTELQSFTFTDYTKPHTVELTLNHVTKSVKPLAFEFSVNGYATGEVISAGLGTVDELQNLDVVGKIVLLKRGGISFVEKARNASSKGAVGVIIYNNDDKKIFGSLGAENKIHVPAVLLTKAEGVVLENLIINKPGTKATIKIVGAQSKSNISQNVIATKKPSSLNKTAKNDVVVISSHYDSVEGAPGANDNASGTAMTIELARVLKTIPTDTEIRFISFGAEEAGLVGSTHYVESLSKNEISRIVANFNLDMVGSKDSGELVLQTVDDKPNLVTELAQEASKKLNGQATPFTQGDSSDHVPFANAGIPAALFIHSPPEPWYHQPQDTIDKISKTKLQDVAEIVSVAVWNLVRIDSQVK